MGFDAETRAIIDAHKADFNYQNRSAYLKAAGGWKAYVRSLGGIFSAYADFSGKVKTVWEFQRICQYVFACYSLLGFDYFNGATYVRWPAADSPFYPSPARGKCNAGKIDDLCSYKAATTCCNWAVDSVLYKAGLFPNGKQDQCTYIKSYGTTIKRKEDLKPGDLVHFFRKAINQDDTNTWKSWHHVAIVYSVTPTTVTLADGGSRMQRNGGQWLFTVSKADKGFGGTYGSTDGWIGKRLFDLQETELYRVRKSWKDAESQIGAYAVLDNAKAAVEEQREKTGENYTVYNSSGMPVWPYYRVRRSWEDASSQIGAFTYYKNAAFVADLNGYNVYDNWGCLLHECVAPEPPVIVALKAGTKIYEEPAGNIIKDLAEDGKFTITEIMIRGISYGHLKSGAGWVSLQHATRP